MSITLDISTHQNYWGCHFEGAALLVQLNAGEDVTSRINWNGHATASALVIGADYSSVLMIKAVKFGRYLLPGGHLDPGEETFNAAIRELAEETGVDSVRPIEIAGQILPLEINTHWIEANEKRAEPRHLHHDFVYPFLYVGAYSEKLLASVEASSVEWRPLVEIKESYPRSNERIRFILEQMR